MGPPYYILYGLIAFDVVLALSLLPAVPSKLVFVPAKNRENETDDDCTLVDEKMEEGTTTGRGTDPSASNNDENDILVESNDDINNKARFEFFNVFGKPLGKSKQFPNAMNLEVHQAIGTCTNLFHQVCIVFVKTAEYSEEARTHVGPCAARFLTNPIRGELPVRDAVQMAHDFGLTMTKSTTMVPVVAAGTKTRTTQLEIPPTPTAAGITA